MHKWLRRTLERTPEHTLIEWFERLENKRKFKGLNKVEKKLREEIADNLWEQHRL